MTYSPHFEKETELWYHHFVTKPSTLTQFPLERVSAMVQIANSVFSWYDYAYFRVIFDRKWRFHVCNWLKCNGLSKLHTKTAPSFKSL